MTVVQPQQMQPHLLRILTEEAQLLAELEQLLGRETAILQGEDVQAIQRIGTERQRCVERLTQLDAERADACRLLSFGRGPEAIDKLLAWADRSGELHRRWQANLRLARGCRDVNDRNGAIVAVKLARVQQLLGKLRGTPLPAVYGPKAARYAALGPRDLGRA